MGKGAIAELPAFLARFGGKGFFLVCEPLAETIRPYVGAGTMMIFEEECCEEELERIQKRAGAADATVILGIGGGKIIDASKITAVRMKLPIVIVSDDRRYQCVFYLRHRCVYPRRGLCEKHLFAG